MKVKATFEIEIEDEIFLDGTEFTETDEVLSDLRNRLKVYDEDIYIENQDVIEIVWIEKVKFKIEGED